MASPKFDPQLNDIAKEPYMANKKKLKKTH